MRSDGSLQIERKVRVRTRDFTQQLLDGKAFYKQGIHMLVLVFLSLANLFFYCFRTWPLIIAFGWTS